MKRDLHSITANGSAKLDDGNENHEIGLLSLIMSAIEKNGENLTLTITYLLR